MLVDGDGGWGWCVDESHLLVSLLMNLSDRVVDGGRLDNWGTNNNMLLDWDLSNDMLNLLLSESLAPLATEFDLLSSEMSQSDLSLLESSDEEEVGTDQGEHHDVEECAAVAVLLVVSAMLLSVMATISVMIFLIFHIVILVSSLVSSELFGVMALERKSSDDFHLVIFVVILVLLRFNSWWSLVMSFAATVSLVISMSSILKRLEHLEEMRSNVIKLAALENGWRESSGILDGVTSWLHGGGIAP